MKLSPYQVKVVEHLRAHGGELRRLPGGFWVTRDVILRAGNSPAHGEFWCGTHTVRALERKGVLRRMNVFADQWRDTLMLEPAFWAASGSPVTL